MQVCLVLGKDALRWCCGDVLHSLPRCPLVQAGSISSSTGAVSCDSCAAGYIAHSSGLANCTACNPGRVQPGAGQAVCLPCGTGHFANGSGNLVCRYTSLSIILVKVSQGSATARVTLSSMLFDLCFCCPLMALRAHSFCDPRPWLSHMCVRVEWVRVLYPSTSYSLVALLSCLSLYISCFQSMQAGHFLGQHWPRQLQGTLWCYVRTFSQVVVN